MTMCMHGKLFACLYIEIIRGASSSGGDGPLNSPYELVPSFLSLVLPPNFKLFLLPMN